MIDMSTKMPVIRTLTSRDLERVVDIDTKVLGKSRPEYWEMKLERLEKGSPVASLVVNWRDWSLLQFFDAMGFKKGDMINLELKV